MLRYKKAAEILYSYVLGDSNIKEICKIDELTNFLKLLTIQRNETRQISFEFVKLSSNDHLSQEKNNNILDSKNNKTIPDLWLYDDGEIHFDDNVYLDNNSLFKHLTVAVFNDQFNFQKPNKVFYYKNKIVKIDGIIEVTNFFSVGYGENKYHIFPGSWVVKYNNKPLCFDEETAKRINFYTKKTDQLGKAITNINIFPVTIFNQPLLVKAALWWINYLENQGHINFKNNNKHYDSIDLYKKFSNSLVKILIENGVIKYNDDFYFLKIKGNDYRLPEEIITALKIVNYHENVNIKLDHNIIMRIYHNGYITVNDEIVLSNTQIKRFTHYEKDFIKAPYVRIIGNVFRLIEINLENFVGNLYAKDIKTNHYEALNIDLNLMNMFTNNSNKNKIYFKLNYQDLKIDTAFIASDQQIIEILKDPTKMQKIFKENTSFAMHLNAAFYCEV